jgi:hypothetical protein
MNTVELKDLVGLHMLSGVEGHYGRWPELLEDTFRDSNAISFILDGVTYTAIEDPDDGWRSTMKAILVDIQNVSNTFQPVQVLCVMDDDDPFIRVFDTKTQEVVLEVGTEWPDSYYPEFVARWYPENLSLNEGKA